MTPARAAAAPSRSPARAPAPGRRPVGPRRVSGPSRRPTDSPQRPQHPQRPLRRVVDSPFLDRLIRGRTWIAIVGFALIGIVTMQVALLKLNAGIGGSVQHAAVLTRENALLATRISTLRAGDLRRVDAAHQGMVYAPAGDVRYLRVSSGDAARAAASLVPPSLHPAAAPVIGTPQRATGSGIAAGSSATAH